MDNLLYMVHEKQLDTMCKDVDSGVILKRLLYQSNVSPSLYLLSLRLLYFLHLGLFSFFQAQILHGLSRVWGCEDVKARPHNGKKDSCFNLG